MRTITIKKNDCDQRLDKFLNKYLKKMPLPLLYKHIRLKRIKVNDKKCEAAYHLKEGDVIKLYVNDEFFEDGAENPQNFLKLNPSLTIVYEDENILLVDKPSGMITHEDNTEKFNTLINHIKAYLYQKGEYDPENELSFAPALCNRIDRNTGGITIAAKNAASLRILNEKIKNRELHKYYLCIVVGTLEQKSGTLTGYLKKDASSNMVSVFQKPRPGALSIITRYRVLKEKKGQSLLEVELITGRTHQIRAHFASIGHPLLGDGKYGYNRENKEAGRKWQALYSHKLTFDFKTPGQILSYLDKKTFQVKKVDFADNF
jgi:23S rRNA pseudouridine955/2504/2580 synthase